ncbi:MAG: iron-containing alcohol dehydrogenase [Phascolarctobacterium sp.]|nr:iron-containing alcohol dehydrogenase [Phascolarctobacterium sp.]
MTNLHFHAPSQVVFGPDTEKQVGSLCKQYGARKVLIHYGGGSAVRSGLIDRVKTSLEEAGLAYLTLGGVVANPQLGLAREGIQLCKKEGVDFILAVGGGSVIDSSKCIAYGIVNEGDVWEYYARKKVPTGCAPVGSILTIAAAGSEMSNTSVITNEDGWLKRSLATSYGFCKFSILNPELTYTVSAYQTASGSTDIILHTLERYFVAPQTQTLTLFDGIAETLLKTVMQYTPLALIDPKNYNARANLMWCATFSHNDVTGDRSIGDWASHQIEHELSGMFKVAHGAGLASIWGSWARYVMKENIDRFIQLAHNVFDIEDKVSKEYTALAGIEAMEEFFKCINMPTSIPELIGRKLTEEEIKTLAFKCSFMGTRTVGKFKVLDIPDIEEIYRMANK